MSEKNEDLRQVQLIHNQIEERRKIERIKGKVKEVSDIPIEAVKRAADGSDDNEALQGQHKVQKFIKPLEHLAGDMTDASRRAEILRVSQAELNKGLAGDRFFQELKNGSSDKLDFNNITHGDLKAFRELRKNPDLSHGDLMKMRLSDTSRAGDNQKERKQIFELKRAVAVNLYEEDLKKFAEESSNLFTDKQLKIINSENSLFSIDEPGRIKMNQDILNIYVKHCSSAGEFKNLNLQSMSAKEVKEFLLRKDKGKAISKSLFVAQYRPGDIKFETAVYMQSYITNVHKHIANVGVGGKRSSIKRGAFELVGGNEIQNSELGESTRLIKNSVKAGKYTVRAGVGAAKVTYLAGHKAVELGGRATAYGLDVVGAKKQAEMLRMTGRNIVGIENRIAETKKAVQQAPAKTINRIAVKTGSMIKNTNFYKRGTVYIEKVKNTKVYQKFSKLNRGRKKLQHKLATPFRFIGKLIDIVKKKVLLPVAVFLGVYMLLMIIIAGIGAVISNSMVTILILDAPEHFKDFQSKYDSCDSAFISQVDGIINGFAQTLNKKGQQIKYGVNGALNSGGNTSDDYNKGVTVHYTYDGAETEGISSNIEDCLSVMTVIMQQKQEAHHIEALELMEALYKSSHTYNFTESALYPCNSGCETTLYYCNEITPTAEQGLKYWSTDMKFLPWLMNGELYKPTSVQECLVCKQAGLSYKEYAGCTVTDTCFHEGESRYKSDLKGCDNIESEWECDHDCNSDECSHDCSGSDIGCAGYYYCGGHDHYSCPDGHSIKTCFGHVDITMNVNIASLDRLMTMGGVEVKEKESDKSEE